jgi:hypothetical protein
MPSSVTPPPPQCPQGILIEDQVWPKSCGHVRGKRVTSREEAVSRIRAAADARCGFAEERLGGLGDVSSLLTILRAAAGAMLLTNVRAVFTAAVLHCGQAMVVLQTIAHAPA